MQKSIIKLAFLINATSRLRLSAVFLEAS